eukprot:1478633-Pleurochrysis_carterae.AAC.2
MHGYASFSDGRCAWRSGLVCVGQLLSLSTHGHAQGQAHQTADTSTLAGTHEVSKSACARACARMCTRLKVCACACAPSPRAPAPRAPHAPSPA